MAASVIHQAGAGEANLLFQSLGDHNHEMGDDRESDFEDDDDDDDLDDEMLDDHAEDEGGGEGEIRQRAPRGARHPYGHAAGPQQEEQEEEAEPRRLLRFAEAASADIRRLFGRRGAESDGGEAAWGDRAGTYRDRFASGKSGRELYYADLLRLAEGGDSWSAPPPASCAVGNASRLSHAPFGPTPGRDEERPLGPLSELFSEALKPLWNARPAALPMLQRRLPPSFFTEPTIGGETTRAQAGAGAITAGGGALDHAAHAAIGGVVGGGGLLHVGSGGCSSGVCSVSHGGISYDGIVGDDGSARASGVCESGTARGLNGGGIITTCTPDFSDLLATWANEEECSGEDEEEDVQGSSLEAGPSLGHGTPAAHHAHQHRRLATPACTAATFIMSHG